MEFSDLKISYSFPWRHVLKKTGPVQPIVRLNKDYHGNKKALGFPPLQKVKRTQPSEAAKIHIDSRNVKAIFGKKAFNTLIMDWISRLPELKVPWMDHRVLQYDFE